MLPRFSYGTPRLYKAIDQVARDLNSDRTLQTYDSCDHMYLQGQKTYQFTSKAEHMIYEQVDTAILYTCHSGFCLSEGSSPPVHRSNGRSRHGHKVPCSRRPLLSSRIMMSIKTTAVEEQLSRHSNHNDDNSPIQAACQILCLQPPIMQVWTNGHMILLFSLVSSSTN